MEAVNSATLSTMMALKCMRKKEKINLKALSIVKNKSSKKLTLLVGRLKLLALLDLLSKLSLISSNFSMPA